MQPYNSIPPSATPTVTSASPTQNSTFESFITSLVTCIDRGQILRIGNIFREYGVQIEATTPPATAAIHFLITHHKTKEALYLIKQGFRTDTFLYGMLPLHRAAKVGNLEIVQELLASGADPNAPDRTSRQMSPLLHAVCSPMNSAKTVQILMQHGANPLQKDGSQESGTTVMERAIACGNLAAVAVMASSGNIPQESMAAAVEEYGKNVFRLMGYQNPPHSTIVAEASSSPAPQPPSFAQPRSSIPPTPSTTTCTTSTTQQNELNAKLRTAVQTHNWELAKELMAAGGDINYGKMHPIRKTKHPTYLIAAHAGDVGFIKHMIQNATPPLTPGCKCQNTDNTILHILAQNPAIEPDLIEILLKSGANLHARNRKEERPIDIAVRDDVRELLSKAMGLDEDNGFAETDEECDDVILVGETPPSRAAPAEQQQNQLVAENGASERSVGEKRPRSPGNSPNQKRQNT